MADINRNRKYPEDGGLFGRWVKDENGLVAFDYTALYEAPPDVASSIDHWHQVGNDRYTAEAHAGGWIVPYRWERGLTRLSARDLKTGWQNLAGVGVIRAASGKITPLLRHLLPEDWRWHVRWGIGYAEWVAESGSLRIRKRVSAPLGDDPALIIEIELDGFTDDLAYEERWPVIPYAITFPIPMTRYCAAPDGIKGSDRMAWRLVTAVSGALRWIGEPLRGYYARKLEWSIKEAFDCVIAAAAYRYIVFSKSKEHRAWYDHYPVPVFMGMLEGDAKPKAETIDRGVLITARTVGLSHGKKKLRLIFGWAEEPDVRALIEKHKDNPLPSWSETLVRFHSSGAKSFEREATWHSAYLRGMLIKDDYFDSHLLPQGSAYSYLHGAHGAIRDYVFSCIPLIYIAPDRAREFLQGIARLTIPSGEMLYSHVGFGQSTGAGGLHSAPTDLPLFFLWGVFEYIGATGDVSILDENVPFYPKEKGLSSTMRERVILAWRYLRDGVGRGPHDLLRAGSGDWNDPISIMVKNPKAFHRRGESCFNTAMALWVLPRAARLVETWDRRESREMLSFAAQLEKAMFGAWTGEWYLRGWDGENRPVGEDRIFLESNVWCLISGVGGSDRMRKLLRSIAERLDDPSPIGAMLLDKPVRVKYGALAPGWDCNGGVWAAINGLLCWGYSLYDPERAWRNLEKQSLASHARAYPHIWYGIWSGPDSYNAHWAQDPGYTFIHPLTPMREYPVMNSNAHALPLLALLRLAGTEPTGTSLEIVPKMPSWLQPWRADFPLLSIEMKKDALRYEFKRYNKKDS